MSNDHRPFDFLFKDKFDHIFINEQLFCQISLRIWLGSLKNDLLNEHVFVGVWKIKSIIVVTEINYVGYFVEISVLTRYSDFLIVKHDQIYELMLLDYLRLIFVFSSIYSTNVLFFNLDSSLLVFDLLAYVSWLFMKTTSF